MANKGLTTIITKLEVYGTYFWHNNRCRSWDSLSIASATFTRRFRPWAFQCDRVWLNMLQRQTSLQSTNAVLLVYGPAGMLCALHAAGCVRRYLLDYVLRAPTKLRSKPIRHSHSLHVSAHYPYLRPCRRSGGYSPASHRGGLCLISGQATGGQSSTGEGFLRVFRFPLPLIHSTQIITIYHLGLVQ
jgi:hypothetical protein